ncbi:MAG: contractile injection system tape measure protein [Acidobacteriota bacterium]
MPPVDPCRTSEPRHRILRQVLEVELPSPEGAAEIQRALAEPFHPGSSSPLGDLFDELAGDDRLIRLNRLELDLGEVRGGDWRRHLVDRLVDRLRPTLEAARDRDGAPPSPTVPGDSGAPGGDTALRFELDLFVLEHGRLPWWGSRPSSTEPWTAADVAAVDDAQTGALAKVLRRSPNARRRLVHRLGDDALAALVRRFGVPPGARRVLAALAPTGADPRARRRWRLDAWLAILGLAGFGPSTTLQPGIDPGPRCARRLLTRRARGLGVSPTAAPPPPTGRGSTALPLGGGSPRGDVFEIPPKVPEPWRGWLEGAAEALNGPAAPTATPGSIAAGSGPDQPTQASKPTGASAARTTEAQGTEGAAAETIPTGADGAPQDAPSTPEIRGPNRPDRTIGHRSPESDDLDDGGAIDLTGAGAVLLHPFLAELFADRDLLAEGRFRHPEAAERGVLLLAHLTFGTADVPEHDLVLAKLLCGVPWATAVAPLDPEDPTWEGDRRAADDLLSAVLRHWRALRSASVPWLRHQFLLRDGRLRRVDHGHELTIDRRAQDVLLGKLPWGVGVIRLPFMSQLLHVDWG